MRLSKNFTLDEFCFSETAIRYGIEIKPSFSVQRNIEKLVKDVLQPMRNALGEVRITSGYRPTQLNQLVGGSKNSAHIYGRAADIRVKDMEPRHVFDWLVEHKKESCDQIILEFDSWVHVGISDKPRSQVLIAYKKDGRTHYKFGG